MVVISRFRTQVRAVCIVLVSAVAISLGAVAHATNYDESVSGDLSDNPMNPTPIGSLALGMNTVSGSTVPSGTYNPMTHADPVQDSDYFTFTVPQDEQLSEIYLDNGSSFLAMDRMFFGIANGANVSVDPSFTSAAGLLGWTLVGASNIGSDVLPDLGISAPMNFPHVPGASGFSGSLPSGTYTIWLVDGDNPAVYKIDLEVSGAPEPATWVMLLTGVGLVGATMRRQRKRLALAN